MAYDLPTNTNAPEAIPTGPPPGMSSSVPSDAEINRTLPLPPPGYKPGPLAPENRDYENSTLFKIGNILQSFNNEAIPAQLKLKMAQQKSDIELQEHKQSVDNYYKNNLMVRAELQKHNRDAYIQLMGMLPNFKSFISSIDPKDKEARDALVNRFATIGESLSPGGGELVNHIAKNMHNIYTMDAFLSNPDAEKAKPFLEMVNRMDYGKAIQSKEWMQFSDHVAFDWTNALSGSLPKDVQLAMGKQDGSVSELEFKKHMKQAALDTKMRPVEMQAVLSFLDAPAGQKFMIQSGVDLASTDIDLAKKKKDAGLSGKLKEEDLVNTNAILEFDKAHPNMLPEQTVSDARLRVDRHLGLAAKESSPGQFSENNSLAPFLLSVSNGKFKDPDAMLEGAKPGSAQYTERLGYLNAAIDKRAKATPFAGVDAKMATPHDVNSAPVYTVKDGKIVRKSGPMTEGQYRSMTDGFTMSPAQKEHNSKIDAAEIGGLQLLKQGETVYKGKTNLERASEVAAENLLTSGPGFVTDQARALAAKHYPELAAYVARRDAVLGTYAKGLGGEVGVLTDQDIARVKKLFSGAYDTAATRAAKMKAFQQIINLNRKALQNVLTSNQGTDNEGQVTSSQWMEQQDKHKDIINGILGSVEDRVNKVEAVNTAEPARSLAEEPSANASAGSTTRAEASLARARKH